MVQSSSSSARSSILRGGRCTTRSRTFTGRGAVARPSRSAKRCAPHPPQVRQRIRSSLSASASSNGAASNGAAGLENVVIIGSGPAGYTAAIYAARANLKPVVFEGVTAGGVRGGQLMTTNEVENFPGFPDGITGPDLMDRMRKQAARWGAELYTEDVIKVDTSSRPFTITTDERTVHAHSIILATGATAKRLYLPSEETYWGRGISACAICDGASPVFKGQEVAVVGGGDSATEEAHYITKYARRVHLLVRGPKMRASRTMQDRVLQHSKITVHTDTGIKDAYGDADGLQGVQLVNTSTGEERDLPVRGLFYGIGHRPNSSLVEGQVKLDEQGYVIVQNDCETSLPGVFAAGDLHDTEWRQAVTAAGSGCASAIATERYLVANELLIEHHATVSVPTHEATSGEESDDAAAVPSVEPPFDPTRTKHKGQYALRKLYHESDRLLTVLYTSPTCGPCRSLKPMINSVVDEYKDQMHLIEINIERDPEIAEAAGVNGTPTVHCFKEKERVENISGVKMKSEWRKIFGKYVAEKVPA